MWVRVANRRRRATCSPFFNDRVCARTSLPKRIRQEGWHGRGPSKFLRARRVRPSTLRHDQFAKIVSEQGQSESDREPSEDLLARSSTVGSS